MRIALLSTAAIVAASSIGAQGTVLGQFNTSGSGCRDVPSVLYEIWDLAAPAGPQMFDLDMTALEWIPNGGGCYIVTQNGSMLPAGPNRVDTMSTDDSVTGPWTFGFSFVDALNGVHTDAGMSSNGYIYLTNGSTTTSRCCNGNTALASFLNDGPSFALFGQDLNASPTSTTGAGTIWFDTDTVGTNQVAYWTWDQVGEFGNAGASNTCQIQLWDDGRCTMVWSGVAHLTHDVIVGWSGGGGQVDPGSIDFSNVPLDCGTASRAITLDSDDIPTIGQTTTVNVASLPANTIAASIFIGTSQVAVPLDIIGMETCTLYTPGQIGQPAANLNVAMGTANLALPIGNDPTFTGTSIFTQAVALAPGVTTLGAVSSNLGEMVIGDRGARVMVETNGTNTFNSVTTSGFWKVTNLASSGVDITGITFDWAGSSNPAQATMVFDTDQTGMADRFDGGSSTMTGCLGTYRNGSEVTVGLDFATSPAASCDPAAMTGWTTSGTIGGANTDVTFGFTSFNPGDVFEWDVDTDGGAGIGGDDMDGCVVTVTYSDGTTSTGEIRAVGPDMGQAIL